MSDATNVTTNVTANAIQPAAASEHRHRAGDGSLSPAATNSTEAARQAALPEFDMESNATTETSQAAPVTTHHTAPAASASVAAIEARDLALAYGAHEAVHALSLRIHAGTITALVGPNGSGKSTLLKALARILAPTHGAVYLDGQAIARLPTREVARQLAILPQGPQAPDELTVGELVEQGRYPHVGPLRMLREEDEQAIRAALEQTNMTHLRHRRLDSLSGGERQRAWIALALAQSTPHLLLDEPTTFLDLEHQHEVLTLVRDLNRSRGMSILLVLHDLNQAARYADRMVVIQEGGIVADGTPREVLTPQLLAEVFHVQAQIIEHPVDGIPVCLPFASR